MYRVEVAHTKDMAFKVKAGNEELLIDAKGLGLTPPDALLAGLGSCLGVYIRKYAQDTKTELEGFQITVEADFGKEHPFYFRNITVNVDLKGELTDERRKQALLNFVKNCPVHNTLKGNPEIQFKLI